MDSPCSNRCNMKVSMTTWLSQKDLRLVGHEILWFFKWKLSDYSAQYRMHDNSTMQIWSKVIKEKILFKKKKVAKKNITWWHLRASKYIPLKLLKCQGKQDTLLHCSTYRVTILVLNQSFNENFDGTKRLTKSKAVIHLLTTVCFLHFNTKQLS